MLLQLIFVFKQVLFKFTKLFSVGYNWLNMPFLRDTLNIFLIFSAWPSCIFACVLSSSVEEDLFFFSVPKWFQLSLTTQFSHLWVCGL